MTLEESILNIYKASDISTLSNVVERSTELLSTSTVTYAEVTLKMQLVTTEVSTISTTTHSATKPPVIYLSPTTAVNNNSDTWLIALLAIIALCLILLVIGMISCFIFCYKRCFKKKMAAQSNVSLPKIEIEKPVDADVQIINRQSVAETVYISVRSTLDSDPEISDDLSISDDEDNSESIHIRRNNTFTILD
jgi:hypothetical protein